MMHNWLFKHPAMINAIGLLLNFWMAAINFERGGWWLILSALHVGTCLMLAHFTLKLLGLKRDYEEEIADLERWMDSARKEYGQR